MAAHGTWRAAVAVIAAGAFALSMIGSGSGASDQRKRGGTLELISAGDVDSVDRLFCREDLVGAQRWCIRRRHARWEGREEPAGRLQVAVLHRGEEVVDQVDGTWRERAGAVFGGELPGRGAADGQRDREQPVSREEAGLPRHEAPIFVGKSGRPSKMVAREARPDQGRASAFSLASDRCTATTPSGLPLGSLTSRAYSIWLSETCARLSLGRIASAGRVPSSTAGCSCAAFQTAA